MRESYCVCLLGVDGSGKTTLASAYLELLEEQSVRAIHVWSRYRNYVSKPFLALMRLTGHNRKEIVSGVKIGYHDFRNNKIIAWIFLFLQWLDQFFDILWRFRSGNACIVSDRCVVDTLVDLCVDTGMDDFVLGWYGRSLLSLMPERSVYFIVSRDKVLVHECRPDVKADKDYDRRVELYKRVGAQYGLVLLCNDGTVEESLDIIRGQVG